ncbi:MAG: hypothetical protein ABEN55_03970 [Bradymonadaceae bacterium]
MKNMEIPLYYDNVFFEDGEVVYKNKHGQTTAIFDALEGVWYFTLRHNCSGENCVDVTFTYTESETVMEDNVLYYFDGEMTGRVDWAGEDTPEQNEEAASTRSEIAQQLAEEGQIRLEVSPRSVRAQKKQDTIDTGEDVTSYFNAGPDNGLVLFVNDLEGNVDRARAALIDDSINVHGIVSDVGGVRKDGRAIQVEVGTLEVL